MKLVFILIAGLLLNNFAIAQNDFPDSGNAGIGTKTPNFWFGGNGLQIQGNRPTLRLAPDNDGGLGTILFKGKFSEAANGTEDEFHFNYVSTTANPYLVLGAYKNGPKVVMSMMGSGNVGIGTDAPRSFLEVARYSNGAQLSTVLGRLIEGDSNGEGTFLGVRGYNTTTEYGMKSFGLEQNFTARLIAQLTFIAAIMSKVERSHSTPTTILNKCVSIRVET